MGCLVSTPKDTLGNRRRPANIGEVSVYVPGLRIPKPVDFSQSLGDHLSKSLVERLSALRTRIVVMAAQEGPTITRTKRRAATQHGGSTLADLQQALDDYLPVLLGLMKDGSQLHHKVQFLWVNQEDDAEETAMSNAWYEVLSILHLMAMLSLSQANLLLLPRTSADGYQPKVTEESRRASIDIFLKAAGYLDCAVRHVLPQLPTELKTNLPVDLAEGVLRALCLQALGQVVPLLKWSDLGVDIQLGMAIDSTKATLAVKRRLACEMVKYWQQPRFAGWKLDVTLDMESERILGFNPQLCTCCSIISPLDGGGSRNQDFSCNLFINRTRIIKHNITHCGSKRSEFRTWNCSRPFCIKVLIAQVGCGCLYRVY
ncbi:hypothetical protein C1H46_020158 [Malus baccata]|uniref:BRO1 domain-containing protein n=1 Tax=Malus baccata TaxID=106549 RepID=A0A540M672_MALBA|nr:hypothetical protein C1H46_020158 [Malus baccata]